MVQIVNTPLSSPYMIMVVDGHFGPGQPQACPYDALDTARLLKGGSTTAAWNYLRERYSSAPQFYGGIEGVQLQNVDDAKGTQYSGSAPLKWISAWDRSAPTEVTLRDPRAPMSVDFINICTDNKIAIRLGNGGPVLR